MQQKTFWLVVAAMAVGSGVLAPLAQASDFKAYWKDGIRLDTEDETAKLKIGGRVYVDSAWARGDNDVETSRGMPVTDGVEVRALRLEVEGVLFGRIEFKDQIDFAGNKTTIKDAYVGLVELPGGFGLRVGHYKEPFGLEELTSSKYVPFMERSLSTNLFSPSRNFGWMLHNGGLLEGKVTFAVGLFRPGEKFTGDDSAYALATRLTFAPLLENKGEQLIHFGVAYSLREPSGDPIDYAEHPEVHLIPDLVDTGPLSGVRGVQLLGFEGAATFGVVSLQGEYFLAFHDAPSLGDPLLSGFYVMGSLFVTGEHRAYKKGAFGRVKPKENFGKGGWGALELAVRYSRADLNDEAVAGGVENTLSASINWYLIPNARILFNYVYANVDDSTVALAAAPNQGAFHAFENRLQVDF